MTADTLTLETESSEVDTNITKEQVYDLPLAVTGNLRSISRWSFWYRAQSVREHLRAGPASK